MIRILFTVIGFSLVCAMSAAPSENGESGRRSASTWLAKPSATCSCEPYYYCDEASPNALDSDCTGVLEVCCRVMAPKWNKHNIE